MKFLGKIGFCVVATLLISGVGYAQTSDGCLRLFCIDGARIGHDSSETCSNPDSVKVDTCIGSATYNEAFGKKWFYLWFTNYVINLPAAPADTILEVSWTSIDTSYSSLRSAFASMETKYGTLYLKKYAPNWVDSIYSSSHIYYLRFQSYVCVDSVMADLANIGEIAKHYFSSYPKILDNGGGLGVSTTQSNSPASIAVELMSSLQAIPNPFNDKTEFKFSLAYTEGMHLEIYDILGTKWFSKDIGVMGSGAQTYELNTNRLPQGTYYARFQSADGKIASITLKKN